MISIYEKMKEIKVENRSWWQKPVLRRDEELNRDRDVTWLELFFDLVFVVVFEKLSHELSLHFNCAGLGLYLLMFFAVFWVWNSAVYYVERFESEGVEIRFFTFLSMLSVTALAIYSHNGMGDNYLGFVGAFLFARIINMVMWVRSGIHVKQFRPIAFRFLAGFLVTTALLFLSFKLEAAPRITLFAIAIAVDIITPYFTMKHQSRLPKLSSSKFPERFGLLTIIVLGATIVEVIKVLSGTHHLTADLTIKGAIALYIIFSIWAVYFDFIARRAPKENITVALFWVYLHIFLLATVSVVGISISGIMSISEETGHRFSDTVAVMVSTGGTLIIMGIMELTLKRQESESTHPVISPLIISVTGVALLLLAFAQFEKGLLPLLICAVGVTIPNIYGVKAILTSSKKSD